MQLGIFAKTFPGTTPDEVLSAAFNAGYQAVQYNMACSGLPPMPDAIEAGTAREVVDASARYKVAISAVSGTYNMIHPDIAVRLDGHRRLEILAARCQDMSTRLITLCTGTRDPHDQWKEHRDNDKPEAWRDLMAAMETAIDVADRYDVDLGIEPELANVINSAAKARRMIDELQSPRLKIVLDPANLFEVETLAAQRDIVSQAVDLLADRIVMGHAKDRTADGAFTTAGRGVLDYPHYLGALKAIGFDGALVTHGLSAQEAPDVAAYLRQTLDDAGLEAR